MPNVLVVDDCEGDQCLVSEVLGSSLEGEIVGVADGGKALEALGRRPFDLVITDLRMPGISGLELIALLAEKYPALPIILMTGQGSEEIAAEALRRGAASYVPKRYLLRDLAGAVESVLVASGPSRDLRRLIECTTRLELRYVLRNNDDVIRPLVTHLQRYLVPLGICDAAGCTQVGVALMEALLNAIYHGNLGLGSECRENGRTLAAGQKTLRELADLRRDQPPYRDRRIEVAAVMDPSAAVYVIRDEGEGFNPAAVPDPTDPANLERCSGRGLLLIRTFMDEVRFNDKGNEITLIKRSAAEATEA